jgi:hypothetical protein
MNDADSEPQKYLEVGFKKTEVPMRRLGGVNRWMLVVTMVALTTWGVVSAQGLTPDEQAEIDANAADVPIPTSQPATRTITCATGVPTTLYLADFESNDGGWAVISSMVEWEWGAVVAAMFDQCDNTSYPGPAGAHSGSNAWATNLDGCYPNFGDDTVLARTFDLSSIPVGTPVQLEWWHWYHVFESFDYAQAFVNGTEVWRTPGSDPSADWELVTVDLTAYAGSTVDVEFLLHSTTVVNRPGWYIDDVEVSYCAPEQQEPAIPAVGLIGAIGFAVLMLVGALVVLRRN